VGAASSSKSVAAAFIAAAQAAADAVCWLTPRFQTGFLEQPHRLGAAKRDLKSLAELVVAIKASVAAAFLDAQRAIHTESAVGGALSTPDIAGRPSCSR
jgi:hypothetical protein